MCELFGMSSSRSTEACEPLRIFRMRGGDRADNPDGWGLAYLESGAFRIYKEPQAAARSELFARLGEAVRSDLILAHVRKAKYPPVNTLANTHPFTALCCGKEWVFAHNGLVPQIVDALRANQKAVCRPAGETDSEHAFCHVLGEISRHFHAAAEGEAWYEALAAVSELIASQGKFNFLMSDGEHLIAYGHDRLHYSERSRNSLEAAWIATEPFDDAASWHAFEPGELRIYSRGRFVKSVKTQPPPPQEEPRAESRPGAQIS